jgi:hypothetical protein
MLLKRGITIHSELADVAEQLTISDGTKKPGKASGLYYYPGSAVPRAQWRRPGASELKALLAPGQVTDYSKNIYIGEVPAGLKKSLMLLGLHHCTEIDQVIPEVKKKEKEVKKASRKLDAFLRPLSSTGNYKFHRITRAMPGRETITSFYIEGRFIYIGLHIDQSRQFTPYTAAKSGNRISINLGKETRYLAFINLTMIQAVNLVKERSGLPYAKIDSTNISTLFFKYCADYPAVKVALKPYQFYIAPTDNFFHDASTMGSSEIDITIVYTGVFDMPNKK